MKEIQIQETMMPVRLHVGKDRRTDFQRGGTSNVRCSLVLCRLASWKELALMLCRKLACSLKVSSGYDCHVLRTPLIQLTP